MYQRFINILTMVVFFFIAFVTHNSVMGAAPGPNSWVDQLGNQAPANVRRAADNLWAAAKIEGSAAMDAGWGVEEKSCTWRRVVLAVCMCGCYECLLECCGTYGQFKFTDTPALINNYKRFQEPGTGAIFDQRRAERERGFEVFKDEVNKSVVQPVAYSGDAHIAEVGPWVRDNAWSRENPLYSTCLKSGSRDLSAVPTSTVNFVNAHGGWNLQAGPPVQNMVDYQPRAAAPQHIGYQQQQVVRPGQQHTGYQLLSG